MCRRKKQILSRSKVFRDRGKLTKLIELARSKKYSAPRLANIFNCNRKTIHKTLNANGLFLPNLGRFKSRTYCDTKFFVNLSPTSAYWVGFIASDGCLFYRDKCLFINLNKQDRDHLYKFAKAVKTNAKIGYVKSNNSVHINIYSKEVFNSLLNLGITPNKSLKINSVNIPYHLMPHFLRGVFDGDGYIGGKKVTHIQFEISGNRPFLQQIQNILVNECGINQVKIYPLYPLGKNKGYKLQYTGSQIFRILDFLYKNSSNRTRLERKYQKMLELKKFKLNNEGRN